MNTRSEPATSSRGQVHWRADDPQPHALSNVARVLAFRRMRVAAFGAVIAVIAAGTLAGYILGLPLLTDWGGRIPMAIHTALALWLCGSGFIELALEKQFWTPRPTHAGAAGGASDSDQPTAHV